MNISKEFHTLMHYLSGIVYQHLTQIVMAFASTILAIFGEDISRLLFKITGKRVLFIRILLYILLCSFGFAFLTTVTSKGLLLAIKKVDRDYLPILIFVVFVLLGIIAERKSKI